MDNLYWYETIEECEKQIVDKSTIFDIVYASNSDLFECFVRTIRTIMIWTITVACIFTFKYKGFKSSLSVLGWLLLIYIIGYFLMSWVKYNYNRSFELAKIKMIDSLINNCKEYQETDYEEWQKKQILKRFASLGSIEVNWDNAK